MIDIDQQLQDLAASIQVPVVRLAEDLDRGQRMRRRRRWTVAGATTATLAVFSGLAVLSPRLGADAGPYAGGEGTPLVVPQRTLNPPGHNESQVEPSTDQTSAPSGQGPDDQTLTNWNQVLASHLDPTGDHLESDLTGVVSTGFGEPAFNQHAGYLWNYSTDDAAGLLSIAVTGEGWTGLSWECQVWDCHLDDDTDRWATDGEDISVAHRRADGMIVALTFEPSYRGDTVPAPGDVPSTAQLTEAAADPRLVPVGEYAEVPPALAQAALRDVGEQLLVHADETFAVRYQGDDNGPFVAGLWTGTSGSGELTWDVMPSSSVSGFSCSEAQYVECSTITILGKPVDIGWVKDQWGGGWHAVYDGPSYQVRVMWKPTASSDDFPRGRAFAFVTDPRWQPGA